jgi:hypothetical protein
MRHATLLALLGLPALACSRASTRTAGAPQAPTPAGRWTGVARIPGSPPLRVLITLDSVAGAWHGAVTVPLQNPAPRALASATRSGDSLVLTLPATGSGSVLRLRLSADGARLDGVIAGTPGATVVAARTGTREAAALAASASQVEDSRAAANRLARPPKAPAFSTNPDSAKLVTSDIQRFWGAVDRAPKDSLAAYLQREYLERGSFGVREFISGRITSALDLATYVTRNRARYDSVRAANLDIGTADPAIRAAFRKLKALYPPAVFPDVYFVVGRFNSGGTSTNHGLLIGAEMNRNSATLPAIVSHELIHFQQHYESPTLLEHSFMEGTADFVGEMIAGTQINNDAHQYGRAHEHELWQEFRAHFDTREFFPWMYGRPNDGRPNDLGYFIGYRIAQAYYAQATDKDRALREIIVGDGAGKGAIRRMLAASGYAP